MDRTRISVEQVALLRWSEVALGAVLHTTLLEVVSDISGAMVIFSKKFDLRDRQQFVVITQNICFQEFILFHSKNCLWATFAARDAISNVKLVNGPFAILLAQLSRISQTSRNVVGPLTFSSIS